ncbi:MAG: Rieske (2Fe-2S) protein [Deltaproteobacteria bacterium]|nr:Rieske (2Fe-2S) protein [Deltaproteobacteria bacterium]
MAFEPVARTSQLKVGECRIVEMGSHGGPTAPRRIALYRLADGFYATQNECVHRGGELGDGIVSGGSHVVCPLHQWRFDIRTGACEVAPGTCIRTYPVKIEADVIMIDLDGGTPAVLALPPDQDD